jgi:hypothetical protein
MTRIFRKYKFGSKGACTTKINALGVDEEGNPTHPHAIVHLGHLMETPAVLDEEGNVVTEAVLTEEYHVDVLWSGQPDPSWDNQMVWPNPNVLGLHTFGSSSAISEYISKAKELHPEFFPEPTEEELI